MSPDLLRQGRFMQDVVIVDFGGGDSFGLPYNARVPSVGETIRLWFDESLFVGRFNDSHGWELMKRLDGSHGLSCRSLQTTDIWLLGI